MAKNIFVPPSNFFQSDVEPLIFLAGPIQGADNWQAKAIEYLSNGNSTLNIANPRRDIWSKDWNNKEEYYTQIEWETYHLRMASATGAIVFWCAKESQHDCDRAYAQTTRFELAEWLTHLKYRKILNPERELKVFLGVEDGFTGKNYIMHRLFQDLPEFKIYSTLEYTCQAALDSFK